MRIIEGKYKSLVEAKEFIFLVVNGAEEGSVFVFTKQSDVFKGFDLTLVYVQADGTPVVYGIQIKTHKKRNQ